MGLPNSNRHQSYCKKPLIPFSFVLPIFMLYVLDPDSFNYTWKGRTLYLFFLWLLFLELVLDWEKLTQKNFTSLKKPRIVVMGIMASIPIVYVISVNFLGLNQMLIGIGKQILTFWHFSLDNLQHRPISLEYLIFTIFFATTIWLAYEVDGLKQFSISLCLLGAIGTIYMIDIFYPYGAFTPFQAFVPFTASSAAQVLNWMGYKTFFALQSAWHACPLRIWFLRFSRIWDRLALRWRTKPLHLYLRHPTVP
jgi:hypothetical protein